MNHPRTIRRTVTALSGATLLTGALCLLQPGPSYSERPEPANRPPSYCSSSACNPGAGGAVAPAVIKAIDTVDIAAIVDHRKSLTARHYLAHAAELLANR